MNLCDHSAFASLPQNLYFQPSCINSLPQNVEITNPWCKGGAGIGDEISAPHSALGEFFERRHFYLEIFPEKRATLADVLMPSEVETFIFAFDQTKQATYDKPLSHHCFGLTQATRISDLTRCYIPSVTLSISYTPHGDDNLVYPSRDTCGCSFHDNFDNSVSGAIKEFLERQFLTRFWLTGQCQFVISTSTAKHHLRNSAALQMTEMLSMSGHLSFIDISDLRFPGRCVLAVYGCSEPKRQVKYCSGMSYAETIDEAIEKSIYELWQTYRFMNLHSLLVLDSNTLTDPYLKHFLNCNAFATYTSIMDLQESRETTRMITPFNAQSWAKSLKQLSIEGYIYTKMTQLQGRYFIYSKFTSPALFLHMDNSNNINIDNTYSADFQSEIIALRRSIMVPFP